VKIELLKHQSLFLKSDIKNVLLLGGIGSGKTKAGSIYTLQSAINYPKALGGIFANTYKQLINSTLSSLFQTLMDAGITFEYNQNKGILRIGHAKILCQSLENYDAIRGVELGYAWLDEAGYAKEDAYEMILGRMRDPKGPLQTRLTTTPTGFNWMHSYFAGEKKTKDFQMFQSSTKDNPHLPISYVTSLYESYDSKLAEQELEGKFTNIQSGRVYYAFDRKNNLTEVIKKEYPIYAGMDFNVNPMTAVIAQIYDDKVHVIDEIYLSNSNTPEMSKYLKEKYGTVQIIADSTAKKNTTNADYGKSDLFILKSDGHTVLPTKNPFRVDRYNSVNSLLEKKRILINNKCSKLIRDLEQVAYKEGTNLPETSNSELTHISDALGYLSFYFFPLVPRQIAKVRQYA
jgi:PBSX family phage terminase large subunit